MIEQLWLVLLGVAAGVLGSMTGLGGGVVVVPVLTFSGFSPTLAASTSLFAALSNAAASTISYRGQGRLDLRLGVRLGLAAVPGTVVGALASSEVSPDAFKALFGLVLVASAAYMLLRGRLGGIYRASGGMMVFAAAASFFAGLVSSFFGIGGGIVFVPLMVVGMGMAMRQAAPESQLMLLFTSFAGVVSHSLLGHPDFAQAGLLAAGAFAGGLVGARLSIGMRERWLRVLASAVILAAAAKLFLDAAHGATSAQGT